MFRPFCRGPIGPISLHKKTIVFRAFSRFPENNKDVSEHRVSLSRLKIEYLPELHIFKDRFWVRYCKLGSEPIIVKGVTWGPYKWCYRTNKWNYVFPHLQLVMAPSCSWCFHGRERCGGAIWKNNLQKLGRERETELHTKIPGFCIIKHPLTLVNPPNKTPICYITHTCSKIK